MKGLVYNNGMLAGSIEKDEKGCIEILIQPFLFDGYKYGCNNLLFNLHLQPRDYDTLYCFPKVYPICSVKKGVNGEML